VVEYQVKRLMPSLEPLFTATTTGKGARDQL